MDRRNYLASVAALSGGLVLAGCSGGSSGNNSSGGGNSSSGGSDGESNASGSGSGSTQSNGESTGQSDEQTEMESGDDSDSATASQSSTGSDAVKIANSEVVEGDFETGVVADVTNTGDTRLAYVEIEAIFRNDAGDVLDSDFTNVVGLEGGQTWEAYISYLGEESVAEAEVNVADTTAGELESPPKGVKLVEDNLEPPEDEFGSAKVVGRAKNGSDSTVDYLQAAVSFVAENGNLLGSGSDNITNLPAGETWKFEAEYLAIAPDKPSEPDDYTVTLTTSIL
jgi:hypothetical protein